MRHGTRHSGYQILAGLLVAGGCLTAALTAIMPASHRQVAEAARDAVAPAAAPALPAPVEIQIAPIASVDTSTASETATTGEADDGPPQAPATPPSAAAEPPPSPQAVAALPPKDEEQLSIVQKDAPLEDATGAIAAAAPDTDEPTQDLSYLHYYAYSEVAPETKPAQIVLDALKAVPPGTPIDEIRRVSRLLGLNLVFMKAVAKIESNFDPKQRTGSYIGLFQISRKEFAKYGTGDILTPRDNAVAAALKMMTEAALFEMFTHRTPTLNDLYLIHQQGVDGAAEHVSHPQRLAWRSMCATDEGKEKGARWCKQAIWGNTLPELKRAWKNVNKVSSGAFVTMWQQRVSHFYARYSQASPN